MRIRFQADADFNQIIVAAVLRRLPEADFRSATDAGLAGLDDRDVLALAARDGRVLVTHDKHTMPAHFGEFVAKTTSPGVIVAPKPLRWEGSRGLDLDLVCVRAGGVDEPNRLLAALNAHRVEHEARAHEGQGG